jgi:hypothetical protein
LVIFSGSVVDKPNRDRFNTQLDRQHKRPVEHQAQVAQLVEQRTENPRVGGSIPPLGTNKNSRLGLTTNRLFAFGFFPGSFRRRISISALPDWAGVEVGFPSNQASKSGSHRHPFKPEAPVLGLGSLPTC